MKVISVLNQKGGSGKTTLSINIARCLQKLGKKVMLVDADPQGSARDWNENSSEDFFPVVGIDRGTFAKDLQPFKEIIDYVVIDGAPRIEKLMAEAVKVADFILIPVQPSQLEVWACADCAELARTRRDITDGRVKAAFVVSQANKQAKLSKEVEMFIAEEYDLPVLKMGTSRRLAYVQDLEEGKTVFEGTSFTAKNEIRKITEEILEQLAD